jgi:hypothetical protein
MNIYTGNKAKEKRKREWGKTEIEHVEKNLDMRELSFRK